MQGLAEGELISNAGDYEDVYDPENTQRSSELASLSQMQQVNSTLQSKMHTVPHRGLTFTKTTACVGPHSLGSIQETNCPLAIWLIFPSFTYCYASCVLGQMCKDKLSKTASEIPSAPLCIPSFVYTLSLAASNERPDCGLVDTSEDRY